jgi:asparagine synthase (glutamine-hydrolysing)
MCGIAGIFNTNLAASEVIPEGALSAMVDALAHRNPDGIGTVAPTSPLRLERRRLAIFDLSQTDDQPMTDRLHGDILAFDGNIYNSKLLRQELETHGHVFHTKSDSEVILKAYGHWQLDFLSHLRGIFAIALWDGAKQRLILARDHMGVKPLYYAFMDGRLVFASEVRAILASGLVRRELDPAGLDSYLAYGSEQEPFTLVNGIRSLPAATYLCCDQKSIGDANAFWEPDLTPLSGTPTSLADLAADRLRNAVAMHMTSEDKIGAFLSGGIDSSAIVTLMRQASSADIHTFTVVFPDQCPDERRQAAATAERCQTIHTELEITTEEMQRRLPKALGDYDQPSIDGLNTWLVAAIASETGLKAALSGIGGDELFVGYDGFAQPRRLLRLQRLLKRFPSLALPLRLVARLRGREAMHKVAALASWPYSAYFLNRQIFSEATRLAATTCRQTASAQDWPAIAFRKLNAATKASGDDDINRISFLELNTYLRSTLLRDADQTGMAHGLEIRAPLLDHKLVEHMLRCPGQMKISSDGQKPMLAAAAGLPRAIGQQPKRGFVLPYDQILHDVWQEELAETFNQPSPLFTANVLQNWWLGYQEGNTPWTRIWTVFTLLHWLKRHRIIQ